MSNGLETRIERLMEAVNPQPTTMTTVLILHLTPIAETAKLQDWFHRVGKHAVAAFLGGSTKEQRRELTRLRNDPRYDDPDWGEKRPVSGGEAKAISGGSGDHLAPRYRDGRDCD